MEKALKEKMIAVESVLDDDERNQEEEQHSEWKLLLAHISKTSVNPGYQNRDFRNSDGTPVIDPDVYRKLQNEVTTIHTWSLIKQWTLYWILILWANTGWDGEVSLPRIVGVYSLILITFHFNSHFIVFKKADAELLSLVGSHKAHFWKAYGVTMGYSKCTKPIRWWSDDSGITLHRPRVSMSEASSAWDEETNGNFPPIYIHRDMPGSVSIEETNYDSSMKVDAATWSLLQSTHKEMIQTPAFYQAVFFILPIAVTVHCVVSLSWMILQPSSLSIFVFWGGLVLFISFSIFMIFQEAKHNQRMYQEITQRVNAALLNKDDNDRLVTVEFHDENSKQWYQSVRQGVAVEQESTAIHKES